MFVLSEEEHKYLVINVVWESWETEKCRLTFSGRRDHDFQIEMDKRWEMEKP